MKRKQPRKTRRRTPAAGHPHHPGQNSPHELPDTPKQALESGEPGEVDRPERRTVFQDDELMGPPKDKIEATERDSEPPPPTKGQARPQEPWDMSI